MWWILFLSILSGPVKYSENRTVKSSLVLAICTAPLRLFFLHIMQKFCFILQCCVILEVIEKCIYCCLPSLLVSHHPFKTFFDASSHSSPSLSVYFSFYSAPYQQPFSLCTSLLMSRSHRCSCWRNTYPHPALWPTFLISHKCVAGTLN